MTQCCPARLDLSGAGTTLDDCRSPYSWYNVLCNTGLNQDGLAKFPVTADEECFGVMWGRGFEKMNDNTRPACKWSLRNALGNDNMSERDLCR